MGVWGGVGGYQCYRGIDEMGDSNPCDRWLHHINICQIVKKKTRNKIHQLNVNHRNVPVVQNDNAL